MFSCRAESRKGYDFYFSPPTRQMKAVREFRRSMHSVLTFGASVLKTTVCEATRPGAAGVRVSLLQPAAGPLAESCETAKREGGQNSAAPLWLFRRCAEGPA